MLPISMKRGFSANSSSDHSIVVIDGDVADFPPEEGRFGWEHFTLSSAESKRLYVAAQLMPQVERFLPQELANMLLGQVLGINIPPDYDMYVDHQSQLGIPLTCDGEINVEFIRELADWISQKGIVVLGGNDNDDEGHPLRGRGTSPGLVWADKHEVFHGSETIAVKDETFGYWTIFDRSSGDRLRFSFDGKADTSRSTYPELIDVKITDYCERGCSFCYQGSSKEGSHASMKDVESLAYHLKGHHVLEVAIGGGEPTSHPRFASILREFREHGIVPNFTTGTREWLKDDRLRSAVKEYAGSVAFTVLDYREVEEIAKLMGFFRFRNFTVQHPLGVYTYGRDLLEILKACHDHYVDITLLGYKGPKRKDRWEKKNPYDPWIKDVQVSKLRRVKVDTLLAQEFKEELEELGNSDFNFEYLDGARSMYIDLVDHKYGESSYTSEMHEFKEVYTIPLRLTLNS